MSSPLERAIGELEGIVDSFGQGTRDAPAAGSKEWFILRAYALGLSSLRRMAQLEVGEEPAAAERFYRGCSKTFKRLEVPDPVEGEKEEVR